MFFGFFSRYHVIDSLYITLLASKKGTVDNIKILKDIDYCFLRLRHYLKNFNDFLKFCLELVDFIEISCTMTRLHWLFMEESVSQFSDIRR